MYVLSWCVMVVVGNYQMSLCDLLMLVYVLVCSMCQNAVSSGVRCDTGSGVAGAHSNYGTNSASYRGIQKAEADNI